jgi:ribulose-phosphate 3-epimerase
MSLVQGLADLVQIDVMDGKLSEKKSWPYIKGLNQDEDLLDIWEERKGFPYWENTDFEIDLMIGDPQNSWQDWLKLGAKKMVFHIESPVDMKKFLQEVKNGIPQRDSFLYTEIGLAINTETPNDRIYPLIPEVDFVQFMGIAKIGYQGQPFDDRVVEKIKELKQNFPDVKVSVDGAVNFETAPLLLEAGVTKLIIGSAIFEGDIEGNILDFKNLADEFEDKTNG